MAEPGDRVVIACPVCDATFALDGGGSDLCPDCRRTFAEQGIREVCNEIAEMLVAKNKAYGDSALNPVRIFSKAPPEEGLRVRIDDKLSRIRNDPDAFGEDAVMDLTGYLVLLLIARRRS